FLVVLLDARSFIVDVQRGYDSIGDDSGTKGAGRSLGDPAIKDELHLFGTADVEVFSDHIFKEDAAADGLIQDLSEGPFEFENRELITVSGLTVSVGERVGKTSQRLVKQSVDLLIREPVTESWQRLGILARQNAGT